jgi:hypothetical protein
MICMGGWAAHDGGYDAEISSVRVGTNAVRITASISGRIDRATIGRFALRRAAEETLRAGFDLFEIDDANVRAAGNQAVVASGRFAFYGDDVVFPILRPDHSMMIKMFHGPRPQRLTNSEYDAREVEAFLGVDDGSSEHRSCAAGAEGRIVCR